MIMMMMMMMVMMVMTVLVCHANGIAIFDSNYVSGAVALGERAFCFEQTSLEFISISYLRRRLVVAVVYF